MSVLRLPFRHEGCGYLGTGTMVDALKDGGAQTDSNKLVKTLSENLTWDDIRSWLALQGLTLWRDCLTTSMLRNRVGSSLSAWGLLACFVLFASNWACEEFNWLQWLILYHFFFSSHYTPWCSAVRSTDTKNTLFRLIGNTKSCLGFMYIKHNQIWFIGVIISIVGVIFFGYPWQEKQ